MWTKKYAGLTLEEYYKLDFNNPEDLALKQQYNKELLEDYPFLVIKNWRTGKVSEDYDYTLTCLDDLENGWRLAFGEDLVQELKEELVKADYMDKYQIVQIKEKFGGLRWYDNGCTKKWFEEILPKYERLSKETCGFCGKPAKYISKGWIYPYCEECAKERIEKMKKHYGTEITIEQEFTTMDQEVEIY